VRSLSYSYGSLTILKWNKEMTLQKRLAGLAVTGLLVSACSGDTPNLNQTGGALNQQVFATEYTIVDRRADPNPQRNAYFGDLHVHTTYSFDAYAFGTLATPYDAYRFALGEAIKHPAGYDMQLHEPLDFYAITDHAMFMGVAAEAADTSTDFLPISLFRGVTRPERSGQYGSLELAAALEQLHRTVGGFDSRHHQRRNRSRGIIGHYPPCLGRHGKGCGHV
jgi:hypothetical protein